MLTDLEKVDWKSLKHAYGKATDIPKLIRNLLGPEPARSEAFSNLGLCLCSGGRLYSASAATVPFLLEIAADKANPSRTFALILLAELGAIDSDMRLLTGLDPKEPAIKRLLSKAPAKDCHLAVVQGIPLLLELLGDADPTVRSSSAFALAFLPEGAKDAASALEGQVKSESDVYSKASLLIALGYACRYLGSKSAEPLFSRILTDSKQPQILRASAAIGLRTIGEVPNVQQAEAIADLIGLIASKEPRLQERFPWNQGRLELLAVRFLSASSDEEKALGARKLIETASLIVQKPETDSALAGILTNLALELAFARRSQNELLQSELSADQQKLFREITKVDLLSATGVLPAEYGLPTRTADARRWIGIDPPGPLDRQITVRGGTEKVSWPIWKAFLVVLWGNMPLEQLEQALDKELSPVEALDIYGEAALNIYRTSISRPDHWQHMMKRAGGQALQWSMGYGQGLVKRIEQGTWVPPEAARMALFPIARKDLPLEPLFDPLLSIILDAGDAAACSLLTALPQDRRDAVLLRHIGKMPCPENALGRLLPLVALAPSEPVAQAIARLFPKMADADLDQALEVLTKMGPVARRPLQGALKQKGLRDLGKIEAALARIGG